MTRAQEIEWLTNDLIQTLDHDHGIVQLIRDLAHETYHLRNRATRQRRLKVNTLLSSLKEELTDYTGLEQDQELEIAIELLTEHIVYCDYQKDIANSLPDCNGYDGYSSWALMPIEKQRMRRVTLRPHLHRTK